MLQAFMTNDVVQRVRRTYFAAPGGAACPCRPRPPSRYCVCACVCVCVCVPVVARAAPPCLVPGACLRCLRCLREVSLSLSARRLRAPACDCAQSIASTVYFLEAALRSCSTAGLG